MADRPAGRALPAILLILAILLPLSVYLLNRAPLYYFDTAAYLNQGYRILETLGLAELPVDATADAGPGQGGAGDEADGTVDTSRSAAYAVVLAAADMAGPLDLAVLVNFALFALAAGLVARRLAVPAGPSPRLLAAAGLAAAGLGALPFYVAFLMPDILAPVLILMLALLTTYGGDLTRAELVATVGLAVLAVVAHPSHLLVTALFLPLGVLASPLSRGRRWVFVGVLVALVALVGALERLVFAAAVERFARQTAQSQPFLTARLINDGPGLAYLDARCPDPALATCALAERLAQSDDPMRLNAPNILFSEDPATGSYKFLTPEQKGAVAREQFAFAAQVVAFDPGAVVLAIGRNTLTQLVFVRIDMTVPPKGQAERLRESYGPVAAGLKDGWLVVQDRWWPAALVYWHGALYLASAGLLLALFFSPWLTARHRVFAGLVLAGIVINALVCGAISVPAHRYGARVAPLLPMLAAMLWLVHRYRRRAGPGR